MQLSNRIQTDNGIVEGVTSPDSEIRIFRGIPFAAPPVGDLRWKPPQPVADWEGVRRADQFGPRPMQRPVFGDMNFRSNGMSEDCLYLNVWAPAKSDRERLPVLVYFYGGGNMAGDGSEPRYDGESMARRGIVALTVNYRLNVFGFLAHPELTAESPHHASGNYGYLDQTAALRWVQRNIAAFGGDPDRITIAGESAGSISVCAQMVSPLAKGLFARAIGESGALIHPTLPPVPLAGAEQAGLRFAASAGAASLAELRAMPASQLLALTGRPGGPLSTATVDGYFLPKLPVELLAAGEQAHVPLLAGWNSEEMNYRMLVGNDRPTPPKFAEVVGKLYGDRADEALRLYPASNEEEAAQSATDLAGDRFIAYSTWKWCDLHGETGGAPVYRYLYTHPRPPMNPEMGDVVPGLAGGVVDASHEDAVVLPPARGAVHSAEIEYAMGNLATNKVYAWTADDHAVSEIMQSYFANFIVSGDPNGAGLPAWPAANRNPSIPVMHLDADPHAEPDQYRARYLFLDQFFRQKDHNDG
jgi:para-nitrobenzyl esterase